MSAVLLDGESVAARIRAEVADRVACWPPKVCT